MKCTHTKFIISFLMALSLVFTTISCGGNNAPAEETTVEQAKKNIEKSGLAVDVEMKTNLGGKDCSVLLNAEKGSFEAYDTSSANASMRAVSGRLIFKGSFFYGTELWLKVEVQVAADGTETASQAQYYTVSVDFTKVNEAVLNSDGSVDYTSVVIETKAEATEKTASDYEAAKDDFSNSTSDNPEKDPENPPAEPEDPPADPENPPVDPENPPVEPEDPNNSGANQDEKNDIKQVKTIHYSDVDKISYYEIAEYDQKGNEIKWEQYSENNELLFVAKYENNDGKVAKKKVYNTADQIQNYAVYEYDSKGKLANVQQFDSEGKKIDKTVYTDNLKTYYEMYDEDENVNTYYSYEYNKNGNLTYEGEYEYGNEIIYSYNSKGLVQQEEYFVVLEGDTTRSSYLTVNYEYDDDGKEKQRTQNSISGKQIIKSKYDDNGLLIEETTYNEGSEEPFTWNEYKYSEAKQLIGKYQYINGYNYSNLYYIYEYDSNGRKISESGYMSQDVDYTNDDIITKLSYEYDSKGNISLITTYAKDVNTGNFSENLTSKYVYDSNGTLLHIIASYSYDSNLLVYTNYGYDSSGRIISNKVYSCTMYQYVNKYENPADDRLLTTAEKTIPEVSSEKMTYEYDSHRNVTKKIGYTNEGEFNPEISFAKEYVYFEE